MCTWALDRDYATRPAACSSGGHQTVASTDPGPCNLLVLLPSPPGRLTSHPCGHMCPVVTDSGSCSRSSHDAVCRNSCAPGSASFLKATSACCQVSLNDQGTWDHSSPINGSNTALCHVTVQLAGSTVSSSLGHEGAQEHDLFKPSDGIWLQGAAADVANG